MRIDGADRETGSGDDVRDRGAVVALLGEDGDGRTDDPVADLLLLGGGEARHGAKVLQSEWLLPERYRL